MALHVMRDCRFYRELGPTLGECHRDTPGAPTQDGCRAAYAHVHPDAEACSYFEPKVGREATTTPVTVGVEPVALVDADATRRSMVIGNDSGAVLYVKYGPGASPASWTHRLSPNGELVVEGSAWQGLVSAARGSGSSVVLVTVVR